MAAARPQKNQEGKAAPNTGIDGERPQPVSVQTGSKTITNFKYFFNRTEQIHPNRVIIAVTFRKFFYANSLAHKKLLQGNNHPCNDLAINTN